MDRKKARQLLSKHRDALDAALSKAVSHLQIRVCYINAHEELMDLARKIANEVKGNTE